MDTKALRQKILDLAIRGKLVPQDPNDEPAVVLLERIRAEKQQMVKDGKLKPKDIKNDTVIFKGDDNLHYEKFSDGSVKCIEDEIPFELPEGWAWCRVQTIASVKGGKRVPKGYAVTDEKTNHIYIRVTDMKNSTIMLDDLKYISDEVYSQILNYVISKDDIYVTIAGTIGNVGEVPDELDGMNLTENAAKVCNISIDKSFLCKVLSSEFVQKQFRFQTHQVTMAKLALERILDTLIPIAPIDEQTKISRIIDDLSAKIYEIQNSNNNLQALISATKFKILDLAIRGKLVPQDPNDEPASVLLEHIRAEKEELIRQGKIKRDKKESVIFKGDDNSYYEKIGDDIKSIDAEIPFNLPDSWIWCRGYSCFSGMESTKPQGEFFDYIDIDSIDNRSHCVKKTKHIPVIEAPSRASRAINSGSVLFSLVRPYLENIALIEEIHSHSIASTGFYVCNSNGLLLPEYMFYLMISKYVVDGLNQYMKGDNSPSISKNDIENWLYPIPPIAEQKRICYILKSTYAIIEKLEESLI